jgi:hypothetical protein
MSLVSGHIGRTSADIACDMPFFESLSFFSGEELENRGATFAISRAQFLRGPTLYATSAPISHRRGEWGGCGVANFRQMRHGTQAAGKARHRLTSAATSADIDDIAASAAGSGGTNCADVGRCPGTWPVNSRKRNRYESL